MPDLGKELELARGEIATETFQSLPASLRVCAGLEVTLMVRYGLKR